MRAVVFVVLSLALVVPAGAAEWKYDGGNVPIAYVDNGKAQFQFACRGGSLAMGYWVRKPVKQVAGAASMHLTITPDGAGPSNAQDLPLIHADGSSMIVRGPVARSWARIAQQAKQSVRVAFMRKVGETYDANEFAVSGSSAAIKRVLDRCG